MNKEARFTATDMTDDSAQRDRSRDSLFLQAELRFPDSGSTGLAKVRNLSTGGMMAESSIFAARGDRVEVELRNIGSVTGRVAWSTEGRMGIAFDNAVDPKLARKPVGQGKSGAPRYTKPINIGRPPVR